MDKQMNSNEQNRAYIRDLIERDLDEMREDLWVAEFGNSRGYTNNTEVIAEIKAKIAMAEELRDKYTDIE